MAQKRNGFQVFLGVTEFGRISTTSTLSNERENTKQGQRKQPLRQIAEYTPLTQNPDGVMAFTDANHPNPLTNKKMNKNLWKKIRQDLNKFESKKEERGASSSFVKEPGQTMA